jgi:hypothetical protein
MVERLTVLSILILLAASLFVLGIYDATRSVADTTITDNEASGSANERSSTSASVTITITVTPVRLPDE